VIAQTPSRAATAPRESGAIGVRVVIGGSVIQKATRPRRIPRMPRLRGVTSGGLA
jgi:hypothetical protein